MRGMKPKTGLWMGHKEMIIITITDNGDSPLKGNYE